MAVRVRCPQCSRFCQVQPEHVGANVRCGQCASVFVAVEEPLPGPSGGLFRAVQGVVQSLTSPYATPEQTEVEIDLELDGPAAKPTPAAAPVKSTEGPRGLRLDIGTATATGKVRSRNEDSHAAQHLSWANLDQHHELAAIVVADGMGGYDAGDRASAIVVQQILAGLADIFTRANTATASAAQTSETISRLMRQSSEAVIKESQADPACKGMGATAAVVVIRDAEVSIGHVGDCRVYHFSGGRLSQLTRDQTLVARMVELGTLTPKEALTHPQRNEVTQAIGKNADIKPATHQLQLAPGDWLMVACDGLHAHVDEAALSAALVTAPPSAGELAQHLVHLANEGGGSDNCTVVAVRCW